MVGPALTKESERETARLAALGYLEAVRPEADQVLQELVDEVRSIFGTELGMGEPDPFRHAVVQGLVRRASC